MERPKDRRAQEEIRMDWQIATCKAVVCFRKFKNTDDRYWLDLAESHLQAANGFLQDFERHIHLIADPIDYLGADRPHKEPFSNPVRSAAVLCGV